MTPQTTIETVLFHVRDRGLPALREPATQERLSRCDQAARTQINDRIAKLIDSGRIAPEEASDAAT